MKWSEFSIHTTQEAVEPVCHILHEAGAAGVVIEDPHDLIKEWGVDLGEIYQLSPDDYPEEGVIVKAYFPVNDALAALIEEMKASITALGDLDIELGHNKVLVHEVAEEEWATAWKKYYKPVRVSNTITISPTWEEYTPSSEDECVIELDPGMAFGTGTHPTTVLCIQAIEKMITPGDSAIDVGTGSGVLSIAAAKLGAKDVLALDLDEVAVESAKINTELNKVDRQVTVKQNNLLEGIDGEYDFIVANILAEIIVRFVQDAARVLKPNGVFITSGIISRKKDEVKDSLLSHGFTIEEIVEMEDWVAIIAKKA
ncbi:50S ribosomal protein L11 methyltransferase [Bacillus alkalicellulosilyticus]|uniref:50S ribosomal protein L11 methyltransferase n=1 Tax=Alkalihalobacterium alkalicellulosilyticum TaxID=1912214 RepID=UPI000996E2EB|nr:50S ribosomal protein L11 methyltransferase [Bacillus alkalicellulosilyticus]